MVEYDLCYCYGIIVSCDKIQEIEGAMSDEDSDTFVDWWSRSVNAWINDDYFIGIYRSIDNNIYPLSELPVLDNEDNEEMIKFKQFFDKNNLWKWRKFRYVAGSCFFICGFQCNGDIADQAVCKGNGAE